VETKIHAVLSCAHRSLLPNEKPKRNGQTTMFAATGALDPLFVSKITNLTYKATIKHDGMCSKIVKNPNNTIQIYKRYDTREGNIPTVGIPADQKNESGGYDFYWIEVTSSTDPSDQYYQSTMNRDERGNIISVNIIVPNGQNGYELSRVNIADIVTGTYELVGPKVQSNVYHMPLDDMVVVSVVRKGKLYNNVEVPRHFFIRHGAFEIVDRTFTIDNTSLESFTEYVVGHGYEGIVFHFSDGTLMKINRGHVGVDVDTKEGLKII